MTKLLRLFLLLSIIVALLACSAKSADYAESRYSPEMMANTAMDGFAMAGETESALRKTEAAPAAPASTAGQPGDNSTVDATSGRKFIHSANMQVEVQDLQTAAAGLENLARSLGAYIESSSLFSSWANFSLRVPVGRFDELLTAAGKLGYQLSRSSSVQDVTDSYFDLEGRLRNKRILEERYRDYLGKATKIDEILEVEKALSDTTTEVEWLEGSFRDLSSRIELATVYIELQTASTASDQSDFSRAVRRLFENFASVFKTVALILLGMVIYGIPLLALVLVLWLLLFGRVGAVRRLFRLVSGKKQGKA
ncbi:MAG: DUF4349 domain-containing protein [Spirochaetes bacterium]|nr:DUF4349 domain-containing protein [Spirochaetota bacterium]MBU0955915.1 DUF4349 domain-containing protein [Spirochaetota bacterium]